MSDVMIEASGLGKKYGTSVALKNATFELRRGEILGFLGPNGAGKSTTMKILTCFIAPTTGTAKVAGCDIWDDPMGVRRAIGYLPESNPLYKEMLVLEYLEWIGSMRGMHRGQRDKRILKVVEEVRLQEVVAKSINQLSKGFRQRVGLAQALLHEPPILILDEPMTGLDPNQAVEIRKLIKELAKERSIILSTHNLAEVALTCSRALIIDRGAIVADDTPEMLSRRGDPGPTYVVSLATAGTASDVFTKIPGVHVVRSPAGSSGFGPAVFHIVANTETDLRPAIIKAAMDNDLPLLSLEMKDVDLESVFRDLTTDEDALRRELGSILHVPTDVAPPKGAPIKTAKVEDEDEEDEEDEDESDEDEESDDEDSDEEESAPASKPSDEDEDEDEDEDSDEEEESDEDSDEEEESDDEDSDDEEEESDEEEEEEEDESPRKKGK